MKFLSRGISHCAAKLGEQWIARMSEPDGLRDDARRGFEPVKPFLERLEITMCGICGDHGPVAALKKRESQHMFQFRIRCEIADGVRPRTRAAGHQPAMTHRRPEGLKGTQWRKCVHFSANPQIFFSYREDHPLSNRRPSAQFHRIERLMAGASNRTGLAADEDKPGTRECSQGSGRHHHGRRVHTWSRARQPHGFLPSMARKSLYSMSILRRHAWPSSRSRGGHLALEMRCDEARCLHPRGGSRAQALRTDRYPLQLMPESPRPTGYWRWTTRPHDRIFDIDMRGTLHMTQAVVPMMRAQKAGAIVNMSSVSAQRGGGVFGGSHYSAAKGAILGYTKACARELGPGQYPRHAICPR